MEILSMVNLGNLYTEFRKKNFTFCFRNKFLNFWQCHNAKYLKFMCITLDLHTSNLDLHRSRVDVCRSSLDLHTSIPGLSILFNTFLQTGTFAIYFVKLSSNQFLFQWSLKISLVFSFYQIKNTIKELNFCKSGNLINILLYPNLTIL